MTKTFNHFEYFRADSKAFCPQKIGIYCEISGKNNFFFCEDKESLTNNKRLDFLMISISACFLSDAALAIARLLQDLLFFFFLIFDFVSEFGKMSTEETETSVE